MRHRRTSSVAAIVAAFVFMVTCSRARGTLAQGAEQTLPDALVVLPGAYAVRTSTVDAGGVTYQLEERYPANGAIEAIRNQLTRAGWHRRDQNLFSPDATSLESWVAPAANGSKGGRKDQRLYQWDGQWEDASGRVVAYTLKYEAELTPAGESRPKGPLTVTGMLMSAEKVKAFRTWLGNHKPPA